MIVELPARAAGRGVSVERLRLLLGLGPDSVSEAQMEALRDSLYAVAEVAVDVALGLDAGKGVAQ